MLQSFVLMCGWMVQMKEKYTKMRPYGEWLAEQTVILQQIIDAVPEEQRQPPPVLPAEAFSSNGTTPVSIYLSSDLERKACLLKETGGSLARSLLGFLLPLKCWEDWLSCNERKASKASYLMVFPPAYPAALLDVCSGKSWSPQT